MNNADNVGYFTRDVGLKSDPNCRDMASSCPSWKQTYDCEKMYNFGNGAQTLKSYCCHSCGGSKSTQQGIASPSNPPPPPPPPSSAGGKTGGGSVSSGGFQNPFNSAAPTTSRLAVLAAIVTLVVTIMTTKL